MVAGLEVIAGGVACGWVVVAAAVPRELGAGIADGGRVVMSLGR